jgi:hypothetical protein
VYVDAGQVLTAAGGGRWAIFAAMSLRALHRRFLETTNLPIEDLAAACGFGSPATLRHHFRASFGTSPAAYRGRFGKAAWARLNQVFTFVSNSSPHPELVEGREGDGRCRVCLPFDRLRVR